MVTGDQYVIDVRLRVFSTRPQLPLNEAVRERWAVVEAHDGDFTDLKSSQTNNVEVEPCQSSFPIEDIR